MWRLFLNRFREDEDKPARGKKESNCDSKGQTDVEARHKP